MHSRGLPFSLSFDLHTCGKSKVSQLDLQVVVQEEVAKFQITVNHLAETRVQDLVKLSYQVVISFLH